MTVSITFAPTAALRAHEARCFRGLAWCPQQSYDNLVGELGSSLPSSSGSWKTLGQEQNVAKSRDDKYADWIESQISWDATKLAH